MGDGWKHLFKPLLRFGYFPLMRMRRGLTLGMRGVVFDSAGHILLVRHSYVPGWTFPGGGIEHGERADEALARELREEAGVHMAAPAQLHGVFANFASFPGDHVLVYVVRDWHMPNGPGNSLEIVEQGFFAPDRLPDGTMPGARRRIAEILGQAPISPDW